MNLIHVIPRCVTLSAHSVTPNPVRQLMLFYTPVDAVLFTHPVRQSMLFCSHTHGPARPLPAPTYLHTHSCLSQTSEPDWLMHTRTRRTTHHAHPAPHLPPPPPLSLDQLRSPQLTLHQSRFPPHRTFASGLRTGFYFRRPPVTTTTFDSDLVPPAPPDPRQEGSFRAAGPGTCLLVPFGGAHTRPLLRPDARSLVPFPPPRPRGVCLFASGGTP